MKKETGFTLVELLAVIVILAIILVIAVPKVLGIISDSKRATLETTVKMIASAAEKKLIENTVLGITEKITCESIAKLNNIDYVFCNVNFDGNIAKVTIEGSEKFDGLWVCDGTKTNSLVTGEICPSLKMDFKTDEWSTIVNNVESGKHTYKVGDSKTIDLGDLGKHKIRVANTSACDGTLLSQTACGFVLEFEDVIATRIINENKKNTGGWPASEIRAYINETIYNAIPYDLRKKIIDTYVVSGHGLDDETGTLENDNFESIDKLYLLSTREVWGKNGEGNEIEFDTADGNKITRQLDYYAINNVTTDEFAGAIKPYEDQEAYCWWLRTSISSYDYFFYRVDFNGDWNTHNRTPGYGISPAFRIG